MRRRPARRPGTGSHSATSRPSARCRTTSTSAPPSRTPQRVQLGEVAGQPGPQPGGVVGTEQVVEGPAGDSAAEQLGRVGRGDDDGRSGSVTASRTPCGWIGAGDGDRLVGAAEQAPRRFRPGMRSPAATLRAAVVPARRAAISAADSTMGTTAPSSSRSMVSRTGAVLARAHDVQDDALARRPRRATRTSVPGAGGVHEVRVGEVDDEGGRRGGQFGVHGGGELGAVARSSSPRTVSAGRPARVVRSTSNSTNRLPRRRHTAATRVTATDPEEVSCR